MTEVVLGKMQVNSNAGQVGNVVSVPEGWRSHLKIKTPQQSIVLHAGNRQVTAKAVFTKSLEVKISENLRQELCLPKASVSVKVTDGHLHFGPFIGIYALPSDQPGKPFGELTGLFADMMKQAETLGVALYVFVPGEVRWDLGYAVAHVHHEKKWVRTKRPLPDLVIPKIIAKPLPWRERIDHDLVQMANNVPFGMFSNATGDKWTVHKILSTDPKSSIYLPETYLVKSPQDIETMLNRHQDVYVKPAYGTQGRSVFRLQIDNGVVSVKYNKQGVSQFKRLRRGSVQWVPFLQRSFCGKRPFLVQQTIDLVTAAEGRPVDFRWLVQKDSQDQWGVTARVARIGETSSITTNLHTGGVAVLADEFLRQHGYMEEEKRFELLRRMDKAALQIAKKLEVNAERIGELGIDLGLSQDGRVYLIEINPRPGRKMLRNTCPKTRLLSLRRNLEYAMYVTEYGLISE